MNDAALGAIDLKAIKLLYANSQAARNILDEFAGFRRNTQITALEQLLFRLANAGKPIPKAEAIEILRKLDEYGCGNFITGRKGHATRFEWSYPLSQVGKAAANGSDASDELIPLSLETESEVSNAREEPDSALVEHHYRLRPDLTLTIRLPEDLNPREAQRLSDFLKTLPFDHSV